MKSTRTLVGAKVLLIAVLLAELLLVYRNHFDNGYFYDDFHTIVENPSIRSLKNVPLMFLDKTMFSSEPAFQIPYRPLVPASFAFDYWIASGTDPVTSHVTTFIGFLLLLSLVFYVFNRLIEASTGERKSFPFAILGTLCVAFHPLTADVVNYHYGRSVIFASLFMLLALAIYLGLHKARKYHLYLIPLVIACLFRIDVIAFIPILFLYKLFFERGLGLDDIFRLRNWPQIGLIFKEMALLLTVGIALVIFTLGVTDSASYAGGIRWQTFAMTQPEAIANYFSLFFSPGPINPNGWRDFVTTPSDLRFVFGVMFLLVLLLAIFLASHFPSTRLICLGLAWFLVALIPSSSVVPNVVAQLDYRMFLASIGLSISFAEALRLLVRSLRASAHRFALRSAVAVVVLVFVQSMAYASYLRCEVWGSPEAMWADVAKKDPTNGRVNMGLGVYHMARGQLDEAEKRFTLAREYSPKYSTNYVNLGILKSARNDPSSAEEYFELALRYAPNGFMRAQAQFFFARFLDEQERTAEAITLLEEAAKSVSFTRTASYLLMEIYGRESDPRIAVVARKLLQLYPDDVVALEHLRASGLQ